ncbi:MAG: transcriptional regulator [Bacteroidetes bacterium HGW-Bacteroidetes-1]|jgi:transcriptional regulator with XRE-family HTH domain|nr:MAG: transcriptional regulator [Bacteroidetes bacterium HGW-Bacteroidetes-1]
METLGQILKTKRETKGLLLRQVAAYLDVDQAILSKIEKGNRKPTKDNIYKLSEILEIDKENLMIQFLSEKIAYEIAGEDCASQALKVAEKKVKFIQANNK